MYEFDDWVHQLQLRFHNLINCFYAGIRLELLSILAVGELITNQQKRLNPLVKVDEPENILRDRIQKQ